MAKIHIKTLQGNELHIEVDSYFIENNQVCFKDPKNPNLLKRFPIVNCEIDEEVKTDEG